LNFQENGTELAYEWTNENGTKVSKTILMSNMEMIEANTLVADENSAKMTTIYEDEFSTVTKTVTVQQGVRFAELSYNIQVKSYATNLFNIWLPIYTGEGNVTIEPSLTRFGVYSPFNKMCGQVIFQEVIPAEINRIEEDAYRVLMLFRRPWEHNINIKMIVSVFDAQNLTYPEQVEAKYDELGAAPLEVVSSEPVFAWDYMEMLEEYDVSYVLCREKATYTRLMEDPKFRRVFFAGDVYIFQVIKQNRQ
jgi:hypothetical protein